jgi:hypothetical protein
MVDIKCTNIFCPNAGSCYRMQAKESSYQRMYMFHYKLSVHGVECDHYIPTYRIVASNSTMPNVKFSDTGTVSLGLVPRGMES